MRRVRGEVALQLDRDLPRAVVGEQADVARPGGVEVLAVQPQRGHGRGLDCPEVDDRTGLARPHPKGHRRLRLRATLGRVEVEDGFDPLDVDPEDGVEERRLGERGGQRARWSPSASP